MKTAPIVVHMSLVGAVRVEAGCVHIMPSMKHEACADQPQEVPKVPVRAVVRLLQESIRSDSRTHHVGSMPLPSREAVAEAAHDLFSLMYPGFFGPREVESAALDAWIERLVERVDHVLFEQIRRALRYTAGMNDERPDFDQQCSECDVKARESLDAFLLRLPDVRRLLSLDVLAAFDGDPAARHTDEVIFSYPGIVALTTHRLAHELYDLAVPMIPRMMSEQAHSATGIDIHPGATIGESFFIDHGTGVVIGETTKIGNHCRVYQGVTLGAKSFPRDERGRLLRGVKRHPTLGNHVTVYAGATILGGDTRIGDHCVINGGVFLTQSVPAGHIVRQKQPELKLRSNPDRPEHSPSTRNTSSADHDDADS